MNIISTLAAGIYAASNGTAEIYVRGTSSRATYYSTFEGTGAVSSGANVTLDSYGSAVVYVDQLVDVKVRNQSGTIVRQFTEGHGAPSVEVVSDSFTGTDYVTGASATSEPTNLKVVLDKWDDSAGADDWKVLYRGIATNLQNALAAADLYFNVKASIFGAIGDGTTDDTASITSAMTAAAVVGGVVFFPPGTYKITSAITLPANVSMLGCGPNSTKISIAHATSATLQVATGGRSLIRDLWFSPSQTNSGVLVAVAAASRLALIGCRFGDGTLNTGSCLNMETGAATKVHVIEAGFALASGTVTGAFATSTNENHKCFISNSRFLLPLDHARIITDAFIDGPGFYLSQCQVDATAFTGTANFLCPLINTTGAAIGGAVNVEFTATNGGALTAFNLSSNDVENEAATRWADSACMFGTGVIPYSFNDAASPTAGASVVFGSRLGRWAYVADDITAVDDAALANEFVVLTRTTNANFTWAPTVQMPVGAPLTLLIYNTSGAGLTVTWGAGTEAGAASTAVANTEAMMTRWRQVRINGANVWVAESAPLAGITV